MSFRKKSLHTHLPLVGSLMGNQQQHATPPVLHWRDIQAQRRAELIESYGMVASEEKLVLHNSDGSANTTTIIYPINDQKGREFYSGQIKEGMRHGQGFLLWKNGVTYEGEWTQDCIEGKWGTMTWPDDRTYTGAWKRGLMEGVGIMVCKSPDSGELRYEGEWKNGQRDGKGKQVFGYKDASGRVSYEGDWVGGRREGHGVMLWRDGSVYVGQWQNGRREGYGMFYDPTVNGGEKYYGMWKDDKQEDPEGRVVDKNGDEYRGPFVDGKRDGEGIFVFRHGRRVRQVWIQGERLQHVAPISPFISKAEGSDGEEGGMRVSRVQSLKVLCLEAVGSNPRLLKKLGLKKAAVLGERTKEIFSQSRKVARQAWQATGYAKDKDASKNPASTSLYSSLLAATPSNESRSSSSSSAPSLLLPLEVLESLQHFLNSRQARKVAALERKDQRKAKQVTQK